MTPIFGLRLWEGCFSDRVGGHRDSRRSGSNGRAAFNGSGADVRSSRPG